MKNDKAFSVVIVATALLLFLINMIILSIDAKYFKSGITFGWIVTKRLQLVNSIFVGYCGTIFICAAIWPFACGLFKRLAIVSKDNLKKRQRNLFIIGAFFIIMASMYFFAPIINK